MKKIFALSLVVLISLTIVSTAFAGGAKNGDFFDWYWQGYKSGYFKTTGSGLVHMWSYDRPEGSSAPGDAHFVFKPLDKFPDATCGPDAVWVNHSWKARNVYNLLDATEKASFLLIFPDLDQLYLGCAYQID